MSPCFSPTSAIPKLWFRVDCRCSVGSWWSDVNIQGLSLDEPSTSARDSYPKPPRPKILHGPALHPLEALEALEALNLNMP